MQNTSRFSYRMNLSPTANSGRWVPGFASKAVSNGLWNNFILWIIVSHDIPSDLKYKAHEIYKLKCVSSRLAVVFAQSIEARC